MTTKLQQVETKTIKNAPDRSGSGRLKQLYRGKSPAQSRLAVRLFDLSFQLGFETRVEL